MSRADLLLPEGWRPKRGSVVTIEPGTDEPAPPHGVWRVFEQAPGAGQWWLQPVDDVARAWAAHFPHQVTSGCLARHSRVLIPRGYRRARPSDLSPEALRKVAG